MHNGNFFESIPEEVKQIDWHEYKEFIYSDHSNLKIEKEIFLTLEILKNNYNLSVITS
jgi:hypothetical protein